MNTKPRQTKAARAEAEVMRLRDVMLAALQSDAPKQVLAAAIYDDCPLAVLPKLKVAEKARWSMYSAVYGFDADPNNLPAEIRRVITESPEKLALRGLAVEGKPSKKEDAEAPAP